MAKLKPIPMPIEAVLHSRHMQCAAGPVHRAILTVACHYWASGAPLAGIEEETARQVSRIASGHWNAIKAAVMPALADILPELATKYAAAMVTRDNVRALGRKNGEKGRRIIWQRHQDRLQASDAKRLDTIQAPLKTPQRAARYVNPRACMTPQALAALPTDHVEARFVDK